MFKIMKTIFQKPSSFDKNDFANFRFIVSVGQLVRRIRYLTRNGVQKYAVLLVRRNTVRSSNFATSANSFLTKKWYVEIDFLDL